MLQTVWADDGLSQLHIFNFCLQIFFLEFWKGVLTHFVKYKKNAYFRNCTATWNMDQFKIEATFSQDKEWWSCVCVSMSVKYLLVDSCNKNCLFPFPQKALNSTCSLKIISHKRHKNRHLQLNNYVAKFIHLKTTSCMEMVKQRNVMCVSPNWSYIICNFVFCRFKSLELNFLYIKEKYNDVKQ